MEKIKESKWIDFEKKIKGANLKTDTWIIWTKDGRTSLGEIKWLGRWRCYSFFPFTDTIYEQDCLRDIANFIEEETSKYKNKIRSIYNLPKEQI